MKAIKQKTCPGLSGRTQITYEVGKDTEGKPALRLVKSSGGGFLSNDWVPMHVIRDALKSSPEPFTSDALYGLFKGKSVNSPSFLMAVLKQEKIVLPSKDKQQAFVLGDPDKAQATNKRPASKPAPKKKLAAKKAAATQ